MKIGILTGGGDVSPLNSVIISANKRASQSNIELIGFINGWQGVLENKTIHLLNWEKYSNIGGTILKSSRVNLLNESDGIVRTNENIKKLKIDALIVIGGDDTLRNVYFISEIPCILISKTIDNDVGLIIEKDKEFKVSDVKNYFTLGYPSALSKVVSYASLEEGVRTTAYSHERIIILETMGMHAGWLALSSGLVAPDFIILPEFPLDYDDFCNKLVQLYQSQKHAIIVIAEGARLKGANYISANEDEMDDFGNPRFGGSSYALRDMLKRDLKIYLNTRNINAVNPSYLYRSGMPNKLDFSIAQKAGYMAVDLLLKNHVSEHILLATKYDDDKMSIESVPLNKFNRTKNGRFPKRYVDKRFYDPNKYKITSSGEEYLNPIYNYSIKDSRKDNMGYFDLIKR